MRLVERMTLDPCRCLVCGMGNVPDGQTGEIGPFIDLEMESGWQDHSYLCIDDGVKIGALSGMVTPDEAKDLERQVRRLQIELHEKESKLDETSRRLQKTQKRLLKV